MDKPTPDPLPLSALARKTREIEDLPDGQSIEEPEQIAALLTGGPEEEATPLSDEPMIRVIEGATGSRAALIGGPDVWEVIATVRDNLDNAADAAAYLVVPVARVQAALAYYAAHREQIDREIAANEQASTQAYAADAERMDAINRASAPGRRAGRR